MKKNFDQLVKNSLRTYDKIQKTIATSQGDDHTASCLLDYNYLDKQFKITAIDLSKQQTLYGDPNEEINFTEKLARQKMFKCNNVFHY